MSFAFVSFNTRTQMLHICRWCSHPNRGTCWVARLSTSPDHVLIQTNVSLVHSIRRMWLAMWSIVIVQFVCNRSSWRKATFASKFRSELNDTNGVDCTSLVSIRTLADPQRIGHFRFSVVLVSSPLDWIRVFNRMCTFALFFHRNAGHSHRSYILPWQWHLWTSTSNN